MGMQRRCGAASARGSSLGVREGVGACAGTVLAPLPVDDDVAVIVRVLDDVPVAVLVDVEVGVGSTIICTADEAPWPVHVRMSIIFEAHISATPT
jgi:hypothetical protein